MRIPLLPMTIAFLAGRLLGGVCPPREWPTLPFVLLFVLVGTGIWQKRPRAAASCLMILFAVLGYLALPPFPDAIGTEFSSLDGASGGTFEGKVLAVHLRGVDRTQVVVDVEWRCTAERCTPAHGRVRLNWQGPGPRPRASIRFRTKLKRLEPPTNPHRRNRESEPEIVRKGFVGQHAWSHVNSSARHPAPRGSWRRLERAIDEFRTRVRSRLEAFYLTHSRPDVSGLVLGLALGNRSQITDETRAEFAKAGLAHLLAISGTHMAVVALGIELLIRKMLLSLPRVNRLPILAIAPVVAVVPVAAYGLLVGLTPSIGRALLMGTTVLAMKAASRRVYSGTVLTFAGLVVMIVDPMAPWDIGCQLSFASVWALIVLMPRLERVVRLCMDLLRGRDNRLGNGPGRVIAYILRLMATSTAATIGTAPLCALHFGSISLVGILANVAAVPLVAALALPLVLCAGVLELAGLPVSGAVLELADPPLRATLEIGRVFGGPGGVPTLDTAVDPLGAVLLALLLGGGLLKGWPRLVIPLISGLAFAVVYVPSLDWPLEPPELRVTQLDVGQGDCIILHLPGKRVVVVDGGGALGFAPPRARPRSGDRSSRRRVSFDPGCSIIAPYLAREGYSRIDLIILSHPHPDHLGGLLSLAQEMEVGQVWVGAVPDKQGAFAGFVDRLIEHGIPTTEVDATRELPSLGGVKFRCLHPVPGWQDRLETKRARSVNNGSLVLEVSFGEFDLLLAGDIEHEVEALLVEEGRLGPVDVVKVPHHGSDTSSSSPLVRALDPRIVTIGVGRDNRFGFPRHEVLRRWRSQGARVFRTDQDGAVEIRTNGLEVEVSTYAGGHRTRFSSPLATAPRSYLGATF